MSDVHRDEETALKLSDAAKELVKTRGLGELADKMGITMRELSAEYAVAQMPAEGNRQPYGVVHGGAYVVLGESLGSFAANVWAGEGRIAVGIEINATHTRSTSSGTITGVARAIHLGRSLTTHEIEISDERGRRLSTVRITNFIKDLS